MILFKKDFLLLLSYLFCIICRGGVLYQCSIPFWCSTTQSILYWLNSNSFHLKSVWVKINTSIRDVPTSNDTEHSMYISREYKTPTKENGNFAPQLTTTLQEKCQNVSCNILWHRHNQKKKKAHKTKSSYLHITSILLSPNICEKPWNTFKSTHAITKLYRTYKRCSKYYADSYIGWLGTKFYRIYIKDVASIMLTFTLGDFLNIPRPHFKIPWPLGNMGWSVDF